ncbi:hypothetical protein SAMN05446589_7228 [Streptomyces sp. OV198]|nr:hypothetical protein BX281_8825 [Streptomyces sp. Ag82_O1-15]SOE77495.1 hypothetical protein SAMN05446589_7228 [Streptomyces sp. OV198]
MNSAHLPYHRRVEQVPRARRILGACTGSKAARALRENLGEKECEVIRKEENVHAEAHPVWDVKMLPTEDDPGRRD